MPIIIGAAVFAFVSWAEQVPELPEWQVARNQSELNSEIHIAAASQLDELQPQSIGRNREYCGYLFGPEDEIEASMPLSGDRESCTTDYAFGGRGDVRATYHSHAAYDFNYDSEVPSSGDLRIAIKRDMDDYVATPGGRLWHLSAEYEAAMLICGEGCLQSDPEYVPCTADESAISYRLADLKARSERREITC